MSDSFKAVEKPLKPLQLENFWW